MSKTKKEENVNLIELNSEEKPDITDFFSFYPGIVYSSHPDRNNKYRIESKTGIVYWMTLEELRDYFKKICAEIEFLEKFHPEMIE